MFASDGCVHKTKNKISINAQERDKEHIESFAQFLKYSGQVNFRYAEAKGNKYPSVYLEIYSKYIKNKLSEYGIVPAKSNLDIDYLSFIPNEYKLNFIFGYFDGDGSILDIKIDKSTFRFEILGNYKFIKHIHNFMEENFNITGTIQKDTRYRCTKYKYQIFNSQKFLPILKEYIKYPYIIERKKKKVEAWIEHIEKRLKEKSPQESLPKPIRIHRKSTPQNKPCPICGKQIQYNSQYCESCYHIQSRKVERPTKEELSNLILQYPITKIGEMHGVSDNAVRKWLKSYDLPIKSADIKAFRELHKQSQEESSV